MTALAPTSRRVGTALRLVSTLDMPREDWLEYRRLGIGASEAAAAIGINHYQTPYELWRIKTGVDADVDLSSNERVAWGNRLEDAVALQFAEETGKRVERVHAILQAQEQPFMLCNLDRRVIGEDAVLEVKTAGEWAARADDWGPSGSDGVPMHYLVQVMHQLIVTGFSVGYLAVLIGGQEFRHYVIKRDEELVATIIDRERNFWNEVVEKRAPAATAVADVQLQFPRHISKPIEATKEILDEFDAIVDLKREIKAAEERLEEHKLAVCSFLGEHDELAFQGQTLATWRAGKPRATFDAKAHAADQPACHSEYAGVGSASRTFLIKEPK